MEKSDCIRGCWISGAIAGLLTLLLVSGAGDTEWPGGLFLGIMVGWFLGRSLIWLNCDGAQAPMAEDPGLKGPPLPVPAAPPVPSRPERPADGAEGAGISVPDRRAEAAEGPDDDLKQIIGIGPKTEAMLKAHGVARLRQIADWDAGAEAEFASRLGRLGARIGTDGWVAQARALLDEGGGNG